MVNDNRQKKTRPKRRTGRKPLDDDTRLITLGVRIPPPYVRVLIEIAAETGRPATKSAALKLAVDCLIERHRPGLLETLKSQSG